MQSRFLFCNLIAMNGKLSSVDTNDFVLPLATLHQRVQAGEGVRSNDVPVRTPDYINYAAIGKLGSQVKLMVVTAARLQENGGVIDVGDANLRRGPGPKGYPVEMTGDLVPQHTPERRMNVCRAIAKKLYDILTLENNPDRRFGQPYAYLTSPGNETFIRLTQDDLEEFRISISDPNKDNSVLQSWIEQDVGPLLTQMLSSDDAFVGKHIVVSKVDGSGSPTDLQLNLVQNKAEKASPPEQSFI